MNQFTFGLNSRKFLGWLYQSIFLIIILSSIYFLFSNLKLNLSKQNIASGFDFLSQEASFAISEFSIPYSTDSDYGRALLVGALNTFKVAFFGNIFAIFLGIFFGVGSLSKNFLLNIISYIYIESFRNIPLLLQLFFWYALFTEILPGVGEALEPISDVFLSNRGLVFPWPTDGKFSLPILEGFNFSGGKTLSPEFLSLLLGLTLYTGAFISEIVRAGIEGISKGQWEAAQSLGLNNWQTLKLVILPQSMRIIIPPLTSQILNLTKNSSLAVAIGYPDFVSIANTSLNQTGRAVELISLIMLFYLSLSLLISFCMNFYNNKMTLVEI